MNSRLPDWSQGTQVDAWIRSLRPNLNGERGALSAIRPSLCLTEMEPDSTGLTKVCRTVFLTNRECPWHCLMCDLWRQTSLRPLPSGSIPQQIQFALEGAAPADWLKLYNAGSFFDAGAIPRADHPIIAELCRPFQRVIVECHPSLVSDRIRNFQERLGNTQLEVALGLETADSELLTRLNKRMTLDDFARAAAFLGSTGVEMRAFVLVKPPFQSESEALDWAVRSAEFAFNAGVGVVSLIPTRAGNGALEELARRGEFSEPSLQLLETVFDQVLQLRRGRVFADLWDLERFRNGAPDFQERRDRLALMNLTQSVRPRIGASR